MSLFTLGARLAADARRLAATIKIPRNDAMREIRRMASFALKLTPAQLIIRERESPGRFDLSPYGIVFDRRLRGEPMAYILGEAPFREHMFRVSPHVLIPRPETEVVVEEALRVLDLGAQKRVLDLGTGSGCIAISIALSRPDAAVLASDFHEEGLAVAQENGQLLGANNLSYVRSDWYDALEGGRFDVIVSNPPYIAAEDPHLPGLAFEPAHALVGGPDGLAALRVVIGQAPGYLEAGGTLIVEHGYDQQDAVKQLFIDAGFGSVETRADLGERPRAVLGVLEQKAAPKARRRKTVANV